MMTKLHEPWLFRSLSLLGAVWMVAILFGWTFGIDSLPRSAPDRAGTVPSTAFCLAALFLATTMPATGWQGRVAALLAGTCFVIAGVNLLLDLAGEPGLDPRIFGSRLNAGDRMSTGTGLGIIGAALTLIVSRMPHGRFASGLMAVTGLSSFVAILAGNSFVPGSDLAIPALAGMSVYTAVSLALLFLLMLLAQDGERHEPDWI